MLWILPIIYRPVCSSICAGHRDLKKVVCGLIDEGVESVTRSFAQNWRRVCCQIGQSLQANKTKLSEAKQNRNLSANPAIFQNNT